ncbi:MAG TPA: glycosyltransferase family 2 protein, partial [Oscillatoriaceae cyanobacterium]
MPPETPAGDREATLLAHLEAQPREANGHLELAFLYYQTARFEAAFEAIARSLALNSGAAAAYQLLGLILGALGQPAYAARAFEASLALEPDNETARHCLQACRQQPATGALPADRSARVERLLEARTPTLSACLIVKDEAENLPRCLESVRDWVSEIVVVDTGSTDGTVAIAESFGARVHHFDWCDDFSAARNFSLAHATGDWVLVIDADETLVVDDPAAFRWALHQRACAGYITVRHDWRSSEETDKVLVLRLFQRHARIRFAGHLHENVGTAIAELGWPIGQLETIALRHAGAS